MAVQYDKEILSSFFRHPIRINNEYVDVDSITLFEIINHKYSCIVL